MAEGGRNVVQDGPVRMLFDELFHLRRRAGEPSTREIGRKVALSHTTVHKALQGPRVPRWPNLELIVECLNGDRDHFHELWLAARNAEDPPNTRTLEVVAAEVGILDPQDRYRHDSSYDRLADRTNPVTHDRISSALDQLNVRYMRDGEGSLIAMWDRHAVLAAIEGPEAEILVLRARPHATVSQNHREFAQVALNEWNHTRRFLKVYIGDPAQDGRLPIYGEMQLLTLAGIHDGLLLEFLDCALAVSTSFVDWLENESGIELGGEPSWPLPEL